METALRYLRSLIVVLAIVVAPLATADDAPQKVLFVGNSFTYYNNSLHSHYWHFRNAKNGGESYGGVRVMAISGSALAEHASGLQQRLAADDWDVVVMQGYSNGPISAGRAESFRESAR